MKKIKFLKNILMEMVGYICLKWNERRNSKRCTNFSSGKRQNENKEHLVNTAENEKKKTERKRENVSKFQVKCS